MDGILLVDKPKGWTSHDVVAKIRGILRKAQKQELLGVSHLDAEQGSNENRASHTLRYGERDSQTADTAMRQEPASMPGFARQQEKAVQKIRVGHTGTLDPLAKGLMVIVLGSYTKRAQEFSKLDKEYEVTMRLGKTSDTGDGEGKKTLISKHVPAHEQVEDALKKFVGNIQQTPPIYSAIKVNGQRAYKLARAGKEVNLEPRPVTIYSAVLNDYTYPEVTFTTKVSSGTYIRSLVEDIGKELKTGAYMSGLTRTATGKFVLDEAIKVSDLDIDKIKTTLKVA